MTTWTGSGGGRDRGLVGLAQAWVRALVAPRRLFEDDVAPGDQGPALAFAVAVVGLAAGTRLVVARLARRGLVDTGPYRYEVLAELPLELAVLAVVLVVVFVVPATLHLVAAVQTLVLVALAPDRGGVSETVQVLAYASAPCVLAGLPDARVRLVVAAWGACLYLYGTAIVHDASPVRAVAVGTLPAVLVYGIGFGGVRAGRLVLGI